MNESAPWMTPCFESELGKVLRERPKRTLPRNGLTVAAVLIPMHRISGELHVLLTKRSDQVEHHKGEISFPGGKMDHTDPSLLYCALRETSEEVGIKPEHVQVIGELDDFYTVATSFLVAPFVGVIPYPYPFNASDREIDELLSVPMEVFFDPRRMTERVLTFNGKPIEIVSYRWRDYDIWGATARILKHLTEIVEASPIGERCSADQGRTNGAAR
ncbi:MAG: CoA pyrophosphatase [Pseudomonadota bacterium]